MIEERAYAKINIAMEVNETMSDGYHQVKTIMVPINLYDVLTFEKSENDIVLLDNTDIKKEDNLVYKAAKLFLETYKIEGGVLISLIKNIPSGAGLGGGSADAAACLRGLNQLFELNKPLDELGQLAVSLGADVPFCVYSKPAICTGTGINVELLNIDVPKWGVFLIKPPFGLSTKEVYAKYHYVEADHEENFKNILKGFETNSLKMVIENQFNDLENPAVRVDKSLKNLLTNLKAEANAMMTGSGSCIFVLCKDKNEIMPLFKKYGRYNECIFTSIH